MADTNPPAGFPVPPAIPVDPTTGQPSGQAVYDMLMAKIEPDLVTNAIPALEEKYKNETAGERKARGARYKAAFEKYDIAYREYMDGMQAGMKHFQHEALASVERDARAGEQSDLDSLESAISSL